MPHSSLNTIFSSLLLLLLLVVGSSSTRYAAAASGEGGDSSSSSDIVHTSCVHASYPSICVRTLSSYPDPPKSPREVAQAGVRVSIAHANKLSEFLAEYKQRANSRKREKAAIKDCLEQMSDSVDELEKTLSELSRLQNSGGSPYNFKLRMSNAETWVSAALSDDESCLDGLGESGNYNPKGEVWKRVVGVAKVTSNALYFINQLDPHHKP